MKNILFLIIFGLSLVTCHTSLAADRITASVTVTNGPTTNGVLFTVTTSSGTSRLFTNSVQNSASQVLTNLTGAGSATNLANNLIATPPAGAFALLTGASNITIYANSGVPLAVTFTAGFFTVTYATQAVTAAYTVRIPYTVEADAQKTNIGSALIDWINYSGDTNQISQAAPSAAQLAGLTNAQTFSGIKQLTNVAGLFQGQVSNSPAISGNILTVTNGYWTNAILNRPTLTNGTYYGSQSFVGSVSFDSTIGFGGFASTMTAAGEYFTLQPETAMPVYLGAYGLLGGGNGGVVADNAHFTNSLYVGTIYPTNIQAQGSIRFANTNTFLAGSDIAFTRYAVTSLANGNNAAVPVGTNVFIEVSGPSAAFTLCGINASPNRDGKLIYIVNQTGFDMTVAHQSGTDPTAGNRIITMTGADRTTTGNGTATLIYSGAASRWLLLNFDP